MVQIPNIMAGEITELNELHRIEESIIGAKLNAWNKILRDAGYPLFDCRMMSSSLRSMGFGHFSSLVSVSGPQGEFNQVPKGGNIKKHNYHITYGVGRGEVRSLGTLHNVAYPIVLFNSGIYTKIKECGLWPELQKAAALLGTLTNHDFIHSATLGCQLFERANFQNLNKKNSKIKGYEHYSLATHQLIFAELRKDPAHVKMIHDAACEYADVIEAFRKTSTDRKKEKVADAMYKYLFYALRNLVDGKEFLDKSKQFSRDPEHWLKALQEGKPAPFKPFRMVIGDAIQKVSLLIISWLSFKELVPEKAIYALPSLPAGGVNTVEPKAVGPATDLTHPKVDMGTAKGNTKQTAGKS